MTAEGRVDGFSFGSCTVGGLDATDAIIELWGNLDREDIEYCLLGGVALAWFNILDLERIGAEIPRPTYALTFEASEGLADNIAAEFDGDAAETRLERYKSLPTRRRVDIDGHELFVRVVNGSDRDPAEVIEAYVRDHQRPEPIRVARAAARAADRWDRSR